MQPDFTSVPNPPPSTTSQPDDEPTVPSTRVAEDPAITTPIPDDPDDDLVVQEVPHVFWEIRATPSSATMRALGWNRFFFMIHGRAQ